MVVKRLQPPDSLAKEPASCRSRALVVSPCLSYMVGLTNDLIFNQLMMETKTKYTRTRYDRRMNVDTPTLCLNNTLILVFLCDRYHHDPSASQPTIWRFHHTKNIWRVQRETWRMSSGPYSSTGPPVVLKDPFHRLIIGTQSAMLTRRGAGPHPPSFRLMYIFSFSSAGSSEADLFSTRLGR